MISAKSFFSLLFLSAWVLTLATIALASDVSPVAANATAARHHTGPRFVAAVPYIARLNQGLPLAHHAPAFAPTVGLRFPPGAQT